MSGYRRVNYYELCRLCTSSEGNKLNIFREEGRRRQLQSKIQSYLPVQVLEDDSLPKIVCHECVRKLESYIEFRETVVSAEGMLESYFTSLRFSEDFLKEGKVYVKSTEKERPASPQDPLKIDKIEEDDSDPLISTEPQGQTQQVVVGGLNASNIQIISGVQARVQQYKCAMQMQPGGVAAAVVEATAETHYTYQQQTSQQLSSENSPQARLTDAQPQIQVQNQIQSQSQMTLQSQRSQQLPTNTITQIQQLREFEKRQLHLEKDQSQPQVVHTNTVLLKASEVEPEPEQLPSKDTENQNLESPDASVQNYTAVQATPEVFLNLNFKDATMNQQTPRDDVKEFKDFIKTDDAITRNSIGQISEFLRIRTCPETNSLITVNPQVICQTGRNVECRDCGKSFESINQMNSHECPSSPLINEVNEIETKEEPLTANSTTNSFSCDVCGKPFKRREHLFQHRKLHTGERPYVCTTCAKAFSRKEHLVRHSVSHTGQKMHECEMCGKSFSRKDNLHKHRKTHGVSGPYICETCGKSFVVKHYYLMHLTTHAPTQGEGENCPDPLPYKCDLCHKAFSVKQYLTTHKLRHRSKNSQGAQGNQSNQSNQSSQSSQSSQAPVSTTNGIVTSSVTSTTSLGNNSGQESQVVEMQSVGEREQGQQNFGSNQYQGNVQGFQ
ncbi:zinc finger protein 554-like [Fopius arisanus]|uniref:ZNF100_0 protein n=1 Tax=Fopius arisanus TaxID=64838 RepID=A0A0C9R791_9HYME|nr:PREDICTED: zinc finger protein 554-like [Fopius arisanus]